MLMDNVPEQSTQALTIVLFLCMLETCFITLHTYKCKCTYLCFSFGSFSSSFLAIAIRHDAGYDGREFFHHLVDREDQKTNILTEVHVC